MGDGAATRVGFSTVQIGKQRRIRIAAPFELKDAIKSVGCSTWNPAHKFWYLPFTGLAVVLTQREVERWNGNRPAVFHHDDDVAALIRRPTCIEDVVIDMFPRARLTPWSHQRVGSSMLGQLSGCMLAWDMGSGKTKAVYDAAVGYGWHHLLVACPVSVVDVWKREALKHLPVDMPYRFVELGGEDAGSVASRAGELRRAVARRAPGELLVAAVNYEAAWREVLAVALLEVPWDMVVADESHRISNYSTKICKFMATELGPAVPRRACLSGTPLGNGPEDAYGQFLFAEPALFGTSLTRFRARYCVMGGFEGREIVDYRNIDDFKARMGMVSTRVDLDDVVELPDDDDEEVVVTLGAEGQRVYRELQNDFIAQHAAGVVTASNAVSKLLRLQQVTSGYAVFADAEGKSREVELDEGKTDALLAKMTDLPPTEPLVVFCRFTRDIRQVHACAMRAGRPSFEVSGASKQLASWEVECRRKKGAVLAVQIQAGGLGIDLTLAHYVVYFSLGFSYWDYKQSRARVRRPGQTKKMIFYHLIAATGPRTISVDRLVYASLGRKGNVVEDVVEALTKAQALA